MRTIPLLTAVAITLCACAQTPESIAPSYVSPLIYRGYDCDQLGAESIRIDDALVSASEQQRTTRTNDTIGLIFLGLPVSSLSGGNVASQIASLKGEQKATRQIANKMRCNFLEGSEKEE